MEKNLARVLQGLQGKVEKERQAVLKTESGQTSRLQYVLMRRLIDEESCMSVQDFWVMKMEIARRIASGYKPTDAVYEIMQLALDSADPVHCENIRSYCQDLNEKKPELTYYNNLFQEFGVLSSKVVVNKPRFRDLYAFSKHNYKVLLIRGVGRDDPMTTEDIKEMLEEMDHPGLKQMKNAWCMLYAFFMMLRIKLGR